MRCLHKISCYKQFWYLSTYLGCVKLLRMKVLMIKWFGKYSPFEVTLLALGKMYFAQLHNESDKERNKGTRGR